MRMLPPLHTHPAYTLPPRAHSAGEGLDVHVIDSEDGVGLSLGAAAQRPDARR